MKQLRNQKNKKLFIDYIHGNRRENHRIILNERIFNLNDIKKWRVYLKLILQHINYLFEINEKDITLFLNDLYNEVNEESKKFRRRMGYILGDWRSF